MFGAGEVSVAPASVRKDESEGAPIMIIDCDTCAVRGLACDDCVVTVLLAAQEPAAGSSADWAARTSPTGRPVELDPLEAQALDALAAGGLLPPLRLTPRAEAG